MLEGGPRERRDDQRVGRVDGACVLQRIAVEARADARRGVALLLEERRDVVDGKGGEAQGLADRRNGGRGRRVSGGGRGGLLLLLPAVILAVLGIAAARLGRDRGVPSDEGAERDGGSPADGSAQAADERVGAPSGDCAVRS